MNKKQLDRYLEEGFAGSSDEQDMRLLKDIADLPDHQPSEAYWQHFDSRLRSRLDEARAAAQRPWWQRFSTGWMVLSGMAAVLVLFLLMRPQSPSGASLAQLDAEQLDYIATLYVPFDEDPLPQVTDWDVDSLEPILDDADTFLEWPEDDELPSAEDLKSLWNLEG